MRIVLASTSPFRKELLTRILDKFEVLAPRIDEREITPAHLPPKLTASFLAYEKAKDVQRRFSKAVIIGSDQTLEFQKKLLVKAPNRKLAVAQLHSLSGKTHTLWTAVSILYLKKKWRFLDRSVITFRKFTQKEAAWLVQKDRGWESVGAYKFESLAYRILEKVKTNDPTAIVGLPLLQTRKILYLIIGNKR